MKPILSRFALLSLAAYLVVVASAPSGADPASAKRDIQAVYKKIAAAMKRKDVDAIKATGTPDFKSIANGQSMDADASIGMVRQFLASLKEVKSVQMTVVSVKLSGDAAAEVVMRSKVVAITNPQHGKTHTLFSTATSRDHWVKTGTGWLMQSIEDMPGAVTLLDGKPMPATPPAGPGK